MNLLNAETKWNTQGDHLEQLSELSCINVLFLGLIGQFYIIKIHTWLRGRGE